ncbi:MAG TPA: LL-diaminopimelate aminotransferase [Sedimentisphaerales bacterium]|nr:LL-diaminopimelate aminotransferase [Phycisphaerae bacterium]HON90438.1 LL-diaminopimelate aminotransferase [Sedimentisphaerales bacterium]HQI27635.1 LL-diaminopimelate aminotransferase [Sedimentisphaerales bacterium]
MIRINEHFLKLRAGYLFPEIGRRVRLFKQEHPQAKVISMGIGDVTQPLAPAVIEAMHKAVDEMGRKETFRGYEDSGVGYEFLRQAIVENDFASRGVNIDLDEVFVSDGAKPDTGNMQEIFDVENVVAVADPVYPVYVDTNVMAGRTGPAGEEGQYAGIVYMPATAENGFVPEPPDKAVDMVYLCFPNNPTGSVATKAQLARWVDYAHKNKAVLFFDAAYEAYISDPTIPHSIYEIEGAKEVAIEFRSWSKTAGFTGIRCAYSVVPKQLKAYTKDGKAVDVNPIWKRRHCTKFNGVSYVTQVGAAAIYSSEGKKQIQRTIDGYMANAATIRSRLTQLGYMVYGGVNAPYLWVRTPEDVSSWQFFDRLLNEAHVVCTPGAGFGPAGEGYVRLTAFGQPENVKEALDRLARL